jgi:hypothetical protein
MTVDTTKIHEQYNILYHNRVGNQNQSIKQQLWSLNGGHGTSMVEWGVYIANVLPSIINHIDNEIIFYGSYQMTNR